MMGMKTPDKCCGMGTYECQVPMPLAGRRRDIDFCLAEIVAALNAANIETVASCCGHGKFIGSIILDDGRCIEIYPTEEIWQAHREKHIFPKACLRREETA